MLTFREFNVMKIVYKSFVENSINFIFSRNGLITLYVISPFFLWFFPPIGLLILFFLFWCRSQEVQEFLFSEGLRFFKSGLNRPQLWLWFSSIPLVLALLLPTYFPSDDLSRHMISYQHHYDYSHYYGYAKALESFTFSPWFGFEWVTGSIHQLFFKLSGFLKLDLVEQKEFADQLTVRFVAASAIAWWCWIWFPLVKKYLGDKENGYLNGGVLILSILGCGVGGRLLLARPEIFCFLGMLSVWRLKPRNWILLMGAMQITYYLSFMYLVGVFLISSWTFLKRLIVFSMLFILCLLQWGYYAGIHSYFKWILKTIEISSNHSIQASENNSVLYFPFVFGIFLLYFILLFLNKVKIKEMNALDWVYFFIGSLFICTDQMRYSIYFFPIMGYLILSKWGSDKGANKFFTSSLLIPVYAILFYFLAHTFLKQEKFPVFNTIHGDEWVITLWGSPTFRLPLRYPSIKIINTMDIRLADRPVQQILEYIKYESDQEPLCGLFLKIPHATHVIINIDDIRSTLNTASCLTLQEIQGHWLLFRVGMAK
jgi:hypothetical protein